MSAVSLSIGVDDQTRSPLGENLKAVQNVDAQYDLEKLMEPISPPPSLILCGEPPEGVSLAEVAQMLRALYQVTPIYFLARSQSRFDRKVLIKNGFTDVFFLPLDQDVMQKAIAELIAKIKKIGGLYRSVKLVDVSPGTVLDFDTFIYLPMNNKYIKFSSSGDSMEAERVAKLKGHKMSSVFVSFNEVQKFYEYTAKTLKELGRSSVISETERSERMHSAVRDLFGGFFSDAATGTDGGKRVVEDCQKIVKSYIVTTDAGKWYERILAVSGEGTDTYSHASNVSTYASIFAIALGLGSVEDIALAGLLHDIGMSKVPLDIQSKPQESWLPSERDAYELHPEHSVALIKDRKLVVSPLVHKIILQHHELFNGTGFPKKLRGDRICIEAQVLGLADYFDEMTALVQGKPRMQPAEAIQRLKRMAADDPSKAIFNPALLGKIMALFPTES
jgi:HD-GYP domain-containing protein (c-di-GMP phosphodiesterase class II)